MISVLIPASHISFPGKAASVTLRKACGNAAGCQGDSSLLGPKIGPYSLF